MDPKLKLGENKRWQFQTGRFATGTTDFARASKKQAVVGLLRRERRRSAEKFT